MLLNEMLNELIEKRGISVRELAKRLGVRSANTVARWLTPKGDPRLSELRALSEFFQVPLAELVGVEPAVPIGVPEDERAVLMLYRALRLDRDEALRRLACPWANGAVPISGPPVVEDMAPEAKARKKPG